MFLLQQNILHLLIYYFFTILIVLMFVRWILSFFRFSEGNPIMLFLTRCTEPLVAPVRRRIPPVLFLDVSWFFVFIGLYIMRALLMQALPYGW